MLDQSGAAMRSQLARRKAHQALQLPLDSQAAMADQFTPPEGAGAGLEARASAREEGTGTVGPAPGGVASYHF